MRYPIEKQRDIVAKLLADLPELRASYEEHVANNDELLPYAYLPDAVRDVQNKMRSGLLTPKFLDRTAAVDMVERFRDLWGRIRDTMPLPAITSTIDDQLARVPLFNGDRRSLNTSGEVLVSHREVT
jgi:hypothetical protein